MALDLMTILQTLNVIINGGNLLLGIRKMWREGKAEEAEKQREKDAETYKKLEDQEKGQKYEWYMGMMSALGKMKEEDQKALQADIQDTKKQLDALLLAKQTDPEKAEKDAEQFQKSLCSVLGKVVTAAYGSGSSDRYIKALSEFGCH